MGEFYTVGTAPKGYALIVNNENFNSVDLERREGSDKDFYQLRHLLKNIGYKVKCYYDIDTPTFTKAIRQFVKMKEHHELDSAIIFVMTHGHKDRVNQKAVDLAMTDNKYISSDWIREKFSYENCRALANKPKLLFFQACRDNADLNVSVRRPRPCFNEDEVDPLINDLLVVYACLPGYGAHRDSKRGSWFIQELCSAIRSEGDFTHIYEILHKVDSRLRERFIKQKGNCYQGIYFENWSFNKLFFLSEKAMNIHSQAKAIVMLSPLYKKKESSKDRRLRRTPLLRCMKTKNEDISNYSVKCLKESKPTNK